MRKNSAVSELIGALLVVAMIAGAVGIITVVLISQPHPVEKAAGDFQLKIDPPQDDRTLYVTHIRGDNFKVFDKTEINPDNPAENPDFKMLVDGIERQVYREDPHITAAPYFYLQKSDTNSDYTDYFSSGDTLVYKNFGNEEPDSVAFIEKKPDGSEYTLWGYGAQVSAGTDADFYAIPRNPCVGTLVHFYDASNNNPTSWEWDFGDGTPKSYEKNPSHAYTSYNPIDRYTVTLKTSNGVSSNTETKQQYIQVKPLKASFVISPVKEGDIDLTLQFTDTSRCFDATTTTCTPLTWNWEFSYVNDVGNKVIEGTSSDQNPLYTFQTVEDYTIKLTITDGCGNTDSTEQTIKTHCPICSANAAARPTEGYAELTVEFAGSATGGKNFGYSWNFGDGKTSIQQNPNNLYQNWGEYTATLTATNDCGNSDEADPITINVMCPPVEALFSTTFNPENGDAPLTVQFTDESHSDYSGAEHGSGLPITTWQWDFGDGTTSTEKNPLPHVYQYREEPYTVTLTAGNGCDSGTFSRDISVNCPAVRPSFTAHPMSGDAPLTVQFTDTSTPTEGMPVNQWSWDFGDGTTSNEQNPSHQFAYREAPYTVTLTAGNGCNSNSFSDDITVLCPAVDASFTFDPQTGQAPLTVQFTDTSTPTHGVPVNLWSWDFGDGTSSIEQSPSHEFAYRVEPYTVTLTVSNGCNTDTYSQSITVTCPAVNPSFVTTLDPPDGRAPLSVTFTDTTDPMDLLNYWEWDFGDGSSHYVNTSYSGRNPPDPHVYVRSGIYPVTLTVRNSCGEQGQITHDVIVTCDEVVAGFTADPGSGYAPLTVEFFDSSKGGIIDSWSWDFGDGTPKSDEQNPAHTFTEPGVYTVVLTATNDCGNEDSYNSDITVSCEPVKADFSWENPPLASYPKTKIQFHDTSTCGLLECHSDIDRWEWSFGDNTPNETIKDPIHTFPDDIDNLKPYEITLTVWNNCGNVGTRKRTISTDCPVINPSFTVTPQKGKPPLTVTITDTTPDENREDWWFWSFGDKTYFETTDPALRNPPPHTYTKWGDYPITLSLKNKCGQIFKSSSQTISVGSPANISGYVYYDTNDNGVWDSNENPQPNWKMELEKYENGIWNTVKTTQTLSDGSYLFTLGESVVSGIFRVKETLPTDNIWKVTHSPGTVNKTESRSFSVATDREITGLTFGNVDLHSSSFQFPGFFYYQTAKNMDVNTTFPFRKSIGDYWEYSTSFDPTSKKIPYNGAGPYQVPPYKRWGNSEFDLTVEDYNIYWVGVPSGSTSWLDWWEYKPTPSSPTQKTYGYTFHVPDNTDVTMSQVNLYYKINSTEIFRFNIPIDNQTIPYSNKFRVEVHYVGPDFSSSNCYFVEPVNPDLKFTWNSQLYYFWLDWDNRNWEGAENLLLTTRIRTSNGIYKYTSIRVNVGYEPVVPEIKDIVSEATKPKVKGITTVSATVTGKNRDTSNVWLLINNQTSQKMNYYSGNNTFTASFNAEPYAGKSIKLSTRAYPLAGKGDPVDSAAQDVTVLSKLPLIANFTADPWVGPAPFEVKFTDISQGGPVKWRWNFGDGSILEGIDPTIHQNPIHIFNNTGNYPVSLTVTNATPATDQIVKNIEVNGTFHNVRLDSMRKGLIPSGCNMKWIVHGENAFINITNSAGLTRYNLLDNDIVQITLKQDQVSDQTNPVNVFIMTAISAMSLTNVTLNVNGTHLGSGNITDIFIPYYENFHSNMSIVAQKSTNYTEFFWDSVQTPVNYQYNLKINNLMPIRSESLLNVELNQESIFVRGNATDYVFSR